MVKKIELKKAEKEIMIDRIIKYFSHERGEEIGRLAAELLLDFINTSLAPSYYNKGVRDSIAYISERVEDMYSLEKI